MFVFARVPAESWIGRDGRYRERERRERSERERECMVSSFVLISPFDITVGEWRMDVCIRFCLRAGTHPRAHHVHTAFAPPAMS